MSNFHRKLELLASNSSKQWSQGLSVTYLPASGRSVQQDGSWDGTDSRQDRVGHGSRKAKRKNDFVNAQFDDSVSNDVFQTRLFLLGTLVELAALVRLLMLVLVLLWLRTLESDLGGIAASADGVAAAAATRGMRLGVRQCRIVIAAVLLAVIL